jgi:hypothetical protein
MENRLRPAIALLVPYLAACGAAVDAAPHDEAPEDVDVAAAAVEPASAFCTINPKGATAISGATCTSDIANGEVKEVSALVIPRLVADENALFRWKVIGVGAAGTPSGGEGCRSGRTCTFRVQPRCGNDVKVFGLTIDVRDRTRPNDGIIERGTLVAIVPDNQGCQASCTAPPATGPSISIVHEPCGGLHTILTSAVPGATNTQIQTRPKFNYAWSDLSDLFGYPGITADVASGASCIDDGGGDLFVRARACNDCGCSPWLGSSFVRAGGGC